MNRGAVYAARALGLCIVVGVLICPSDSSGNLGCRFSPVCSAREICREDKLFGTCAHRSASIFAYDLDPAGYLQLKNAIEFLLSRGYSWDNAFAQHSLKIVLKPYRRELELYNDRNPSLIPNDSDFSSAGVNGLLNDLELLENAEEYEEKLRKSKIETPTSHHKVHQKPTKNFLHRHGSKTNNNRMSDVLQEMYYEKYLEYMKAMEEESKGRKINTYDEFSMTEPNGNQQWEMDGNGRVQGHGAETWQFDDNIGDGQVVDINWLEDDNGEGVKNDEMFEGNFIGGDDEVFNKESSNKNNINTQDYLNDLSLLDIETVMKELYSLFATVDPDSWIQLTEKEKSQLLDQALLMLLEKYPSLTTKPAEDVEIWEGSEEVTETGNDITEKMAMEEQKEGEQNAGEQEAGEQEAGEHEAGEQENIIDNEWRTPKIENQPEVNLELEEPFQRPTDDNQTGKTVNLENEEMVGVDIKEKKEHDVFDVHNNLDVDNSAGVPAASSIPSKKDDRIKNQVFIVTNESLGQQDGEMVVEQLRNMLQLPEDAFINTRVKKTKVTFTVNTKYNNSASDIAKKAAQLGTELHKRLGPTIRMTGAGSGVSSKIHTPQVERSDNHNPTLIILTLILVGCILGVLLAVFAIFCYRQKAKTRDKLKSLATGSVSEKEATVDYQDLCRQRMACKNADKPEPLSRMSSVGHSDTAQPSPSRSSRSSTSSWSEEPVQTNMDISTGHLVLAYMEDHMRNKDRLMEEWKALSEYEAEPNFTTIGKMSKNLSKNRFEDVLPYDHTRVILKETTDPSHSDYINASLITGSDPRSPAYISTQAPLPNTMSDFWQMIWEHGVVVIVNLTRPAENDIVQCEKYWPEEDSKAYENYEVHLVSEHVWCEDYLVRSFYLKNLLTNETRTVTQFHYLTWPDNGVPVSPRSLLEFRRKVNKSYRGRCCPILVHCSDGIGRTGTYCLIDMTLTRMIKGAKEIDLAATLEHVRDQRPGMVRTMEQFEFVLTAVAEEVNAILKAIPQ